MSEDASVYDVIDDDPVNVRYFQEASRPSGWLPYTSSTGVGSRIKQVSNKYTGEDPDGSFLVQSVIDSRAGFMVGSGIRLQKIDGIDCDKEHELADSVIKWNNLDKGFLFDLAIEAELEGRLLLLIQEAGVPVDGPKSGLTDLGTIDRYNIRHIPYSKYRYRVIMRDDDNTVIDRIEYTDVNGGTVTIPAEDIVFATFGASRYFEPDKATPRVASALEDIDTVSAARRDLREVNHLFAHPTPVFRTESANEAKALDKQLQKQRWSIGTMVVSTAEYSVVGVDTGGTEVLLSEMNAAIQRISGATGVPVYFLGLSTDMVNRATAYAMMEALDTNVALDRKRLETMFEELFHVIFHKHNQKHGGNLNPEHLHITIPSPAVIREQRVEQGEYLLNMYLAGALSLRTLLNNINEVTDVDKEIEEIGDRQAQQLERKTSMLDADTSTGSVVNVGTKKGDKDTLK